MASHPSDKKPNLLRAEVAAAAIAVVGRIVIAPLLLAALVTRTNYLSGAKILIDADDSYFAYAQLDPVMRGGCQGCHKGCSRAFVRLSRFQGKNVLSKPEYEDMFGIADDAWDFSMLSTEAHQLAAQMDADVNCTCMSGVNEWGSPVTTIAAEASTILELIDALRLKPSLAPQMINELHIAANDNSRVCATRWVLESHLRLYKFQAVAHTLEYSSFSAGDLSIFPEYTECRGDSPNVGIVGEKLALNTHGEDPLKVVPKLLELFPYSFTSNLPLVSRLVPASDTFYPVTTVTQPMFRAYYGACRVRAVNTSGIFVEDSCALKQHWENYGLLLQYPEDIPVCSTAGVCVHNYYNSLWEFFTYADPEVEGRVVVLVNSLRLRYADSVDLSFLPGIVAAQILGMGILSLFQTVAHQRGTLSVRLAHIWAYRCQNGRMQVIYLAQVIYHFVYNSDLYFLGLTTGTLSTESVVNLTLCFFALSYSFINLLKARAGEQRLDRHFRLAWETMQLLIAIVIGSLLFKYQLTSVSAVMDYNGELLRKTTARGAQMCNLSDSCIVFKVNLIVMVGCAALVLAIVPQVVASAINRYEKRSVMSRMIWPMKWRGTQRNQVYHAESKPGAKIGSADETDVVAPVKAFSTRLTSFERECLGGPFASLFNDCEDFAYVTVGNAIYSSEDAVLLCGFLYYGDYLYRAGDVLLLFLARLLPDPVLRTFNMPLLRWRIDPDTNTVSYPMSCPWYKASAEGKGSHIMRARPIM